MAAGAISFEEGLDVLVAVWRETEQLGVRIALPPGARREAVDAVCDELRRRRLPVWIGNVNASTQFVLTGTEPAVAAALAELAPRALTVLPLTMNWPIHSELMEPVARAIAPVVAGCRSIRDPIVPFYGPTEGSSPPTRVCGVFRDGVLPPDPLNATVGAMVRDGHRAFLEVGPGQMLSKIVRWIDRSVTCQPAGTLDAIRRHVDILRVP